MLQFSRRFCALILITVLMSVVAQGAPAGGPKTEVCVLSFVPSTSRIGESIDDTFRFDARIRLIREALPIDLARCIQEGYSEIVIVAHALQMHTANGKDDVRLGYFQKATGPRGESGYRSKIFFDRAFQAALEALDERRSAGTLPLLQKIRFMACDPESIFNAYPSFRELVGRPGIELDQAPTSSFLSQFYEIPVTSFDLEWLSRSTKCESLKVWRTEFNRFCKSDAWPGCDRRQTKICTAGPRS